MEEEAAIQGIDLFTPSTHKRKSQFNRHALTTFCKDNNINTFSNYDTIIKPSKILTPLQVLHRAKNDDDIYRNITPKERHAIKSNCVIKTTSAQQEKQQRKKRLGSSNRNIDLVTKYGILKM